MKKSFTKGLIAFGFCAAVVGFVACGDESSSGPSKNEETGIETEVSSSSEKDDAISSSSAKDEKSSSSKKVESSSSSKTDVSSSSTKIESSSSSVNVKESSSSSKVESSSGKDDVSSSSQNVQSSSSDKPVESSSSKAKSSSSEISSSSIKIEESSSSVESSSSSANASSSSATIPSKLYDCEVYKCVTTKYLNPDIEYGEYLDVRDSQVYRTVQIGEQVWMAQNLNYKSDMQSLCFDNDDNNCAKWGRLYTWAQAVKACPEGWKLPDSSEYGSLAIFLKDSTGNKNVGKYLKTGKNNLFGFSVLLGSGYFVGGPDYFNEGGETYGRAYFWTASETDEQNTLEPPDKYAIIRSLKYSNDIFGILPWEKVDALSVRCLKNI